MGGKDLRPLLVETKRQGRGNLGGGGEGKKYSIPLFCLRRPAHREVEGGEPDSPAHRLFLCLVGPRESLFRPSSGGAVCRDRPSETEAAAGEEEEDWEEQEIPHT